MYRLGILSDDQKDIDDIINTFIEQSNKKLDKNNFIIYDIDRELSDSVGFVEKIRSSICGKNISGMVFSAKINSKDIYLVQKYLKEEIHKTAPDFPILILADSEENSVINKKIFFHVDSPISLAMAKVFFSSMTDCMQNF